MGARCCKQMFGGDDTPPPSPSGTTHYHKFDDVPNTSPLRTTPDTFAGFTQTVTADGGRGGGSKTPIAKSCSSDSVEEKNKAKQSRSSTITKAPIPPPQSSGSKMLDSTAVVCLLGAGAFGSVSLVFTRFAEFGNASIRRPFGHAQSSTDLTAHNRTITSPTDFHGVEPPAAVSMPQHAPHHHYHHQRSHSQGQASALLPARISPSLAKVHGSVDDITASLPPSQCGSFASTSFAQHNIIATGSSIFNPPHAAVIRFSVLKRISKARQAQFGSLVDLAADRFASARLRHPNIVRLIQAGRTSTDFLNMYEFALGGDVGKALSRKQSTLRDELKASWPGWESANTATRLKEFVKRGAEPQPPPKQCTCTALWQQVDNAQRHPSLPVDPQCPVMKWCATRTGLPLNFVSLTAFELLAAIHYLATHPQRFVHGDVKPDNIFINEYGHLQLGDFSTLVQLVQPAPPSPQKGPVKKTSSLFGRNSKKDEDSNSTGGRGTTPGPGSRGSPDGRNNTSFAGTNASAAMQAANPKYNPPEVVNATPNAPGPTVVPAGTTNVPEPNVDMWSYGVTLQELAAGSHPFYPFTVDINSLSGMSSVMNGVYTPIPVPELPSSESSEVADGVREVIERLNDLIRHCITVKPSDRYTATAASRHSFFRHPLVLTHLGVNPMDVATDAADYLVNMCAYPTREAAENDLFCDTDDGFQVDWNHIEAHATLRDAFSSVLWTQYVVQSSGHPGLRPPLVPSEHCVNGGFTLPEAVNLSLSGCDLFASFCGSEDSSTPVNSFGDGRMPPFVPVDLRFFCSTQAEFDSWTDEKNKKRLAQTDAELRADSGVEANVLRTPSNGSQNGRRVGGASHHVDQQPGYTYNPGNNMLAN